MPGRGSIADAQNRLAELGIQPRGLPLDLAAAYVGLSPALFLAEVAAGRFPQPSRHGGSAARPESRRPARRVWDRAGLDAAMDARSKIKAHSAPTEADPVMARIHAARAQ